VPRTSTQRNHRMLYKYKQPLADIKYNYLYSAETCIILLAFSVELLHILVKFEEFESQKRVKIIARRLFPVLSHGR